MRGSLRMWKCIRSSVRDLLELRVGFGGGGGGAKKNGDAKMHPRLACMLPSRRSCCILRSWEGQSQSQRAAGGQESQDAGGRARTGPGPDFTLPPIANNLAETFGWSTAVVVGWYLSHPLTWQSLFGAQPNNRNRRCAASDWWRALVGRANPVALSVFPSSSSSGSGAVQIRASHSSVDSHSSISSFSERESTDSVTTDGDEEWPNLRGPFTPLEALDIATREFAAISREREARAENEVGLRLINGGRHRRALKHFRRASFLDNDQAAYNVGQCYELGLGTQRNIRKAAKWYKIAAARGHPTAIYNLGVFSVHGWGGMDADLNQARRYFLEAAKLGHAEAQAALDMDAAHASKGCDMSSEVDLNTVPSPTQVLLGMLGVGNDKSSLAVNTVNATATPNTESLHWLDLSVPMGKDNTASGSETPAWLNVSDETLMATCRKFLSKVQSTLSFENSPTTEAAL